MKINPKSEIRNPKQSRNENVQMSKKFRILNFGHFNLFRYSIFDIRYSRRGFTLIELLIYIAVFAMVLTVAINLFFQSKIIEAQVVENHEVDRDGRIALLEMTQTIRSAASVTSPALGASASSLALNSSAIVYAVDGNGVLQKTDSTGTHNITGNGVTIQSLTFTTRGEVGKQPTVSITFTVRSNYLVSYGQIATYINKAFRTTVQVR